MSAGQAKTVKKVCKGNNENCIAIAERIFEKMQTKKIGNGLLPSDSFDIQKFIETLNLKVITILNHHRK